MLNRDVEQLSVRELGHSKKAAKSNTDDTDSRVRDTGNDSASTAPRSTEESLSEDVFTESELSPIREELVSSDELRQDKSSGASSESVQTINQTSAECLTVISDSNEAASDLKPSAEVVGDVKQFGTHLSSEHAKRSIKGGQEPGENTADVLQQSLQKSQGSEEHSKETEVGKDQGSSAGKKADNEMQEECPGCEDTTDSQKQETPSKRKVVREQSQDSTSEAEVEELRKLWKTHTMQQTKQQRENMHQDSQKEISQKAVSAGDGRLEGESTGIYGYSVNLQIFNVSLCSLMEILCFFSAVQHISSCTAYITLIYSLQRKYSKVKFSINYWRKYCLGN